MELARASTQVLIAFDIPFQLPLEYALRERIAVCHIPFGTRILLNNSRWRGFFTVVENFLAESIKGGYDGLHAYKAFTTVTVHVGQNYATLPYGTTFGSSGRFHHQTIVITPSHRS